MPWHGYLDPIQWSDSCFKLDNYVIDHADHDGDGLEVYIDDDFLGHNTRFCFDHSKKWTLFGISDRSGNRCYQFQIKMPKKRRVIADDSSDEDRLPNPGLEYKTGRHRLPRI